MPATWANASSSSDKQVTFAYDYMGRRFRKQVYIWNSGTSAWNATPTLDQRFVYDDWNVILVLNLS